MKARMHKQAKPHKASRPHTLADRLLRIIDSFPRVTVTVLGDLVADEFVYGEISRVSREAPVLIVKHRERTVAPGGAGNAIYNLADLGVTVLPVGIVGDDEPGRLLLKAFRQKKIAVSGIQRIKGRVTTTKTRILAGHPHGPRQQVLRVDREEALLPDQHTRRELVLAARNYAGASDALLLSDYGYGSCTPQLFEAVRSRSKLNGIPVTLDSRYRLLHYSGITAATPNEPEVEDALRFRMGPDVDQLKAAGNAVLKNQRLESLVITRGREGMLLFTPGNAEAIAIPVHGDTEVADVTGAGDTVIAVYTAALATGADAEDAARLANIGGGLVVMKRGTATVSAQELRREAEKV